MIGIDIAEVKRFDLNDEAFLKRIAFDEEIECIRKSKCADMQLVRLASLWAVKEAVMKALGLGKNSGVSFKDIKLCHEESGKPYVELFGVAKQEFDISHYGKNIEVSISHTKENAVAVAYIF